MPYTLVGNKAKIIFTSSLVKIYVRGECVATHRRDRSYGYTSQDEHLASNTLAFTRRSSSYYKTRAKSVSESLFRLFDAMFSSTSVTYPPEYYYRTCDMMLRLQRNYPCDIFDEACDICTDNRIFTGKRLENVIRTMQMSSQVRKTATAPDPTDHDPLSQNCTCQEWHRAGEH